MMIILEVIITVLLVEVDSDDEELKNNYDYDDMDDECYKESPTEKHTHIDGIEVLSCKTILHNSMPIPLSP